MSLEFKQNVDLDYTLVKVLKLTKPETYLAYLGINELIEISACRG